MSDRRIDQLPTCWQNCESVQVEVLPDPSPESQANRAFLDHEPALDAEMVPVWDFPDSDDGRAAFVLQHFRQRIAWVPETKLWMIFFAGRWHRDTTGRLGHYVQKLSRQQILKAAELKRKLANELAEQVIEDSEDTTNGPHLSPRGVKSAARAANRAAENLGNEKVISALLAAASREGSLVVPASEWDANAWTIGVANGVLDLRTGKHREGRPEDRITKTINAEFQPRATCPAWLKFIGRIMPDTELAAYLQGVLGYTLTGSTSDQGFYFLHGDGRNGKSILILTFAFLFGDYSGKARSTLIEEAKNGSDPKADIALLPGVRFLYGEETRQGARLREELVKSLVAGDPITGEAKYAAPFTFTPTAKLFVVGNHRPKICGTDAGIWRRVRLIPFSETITQEETVPQHELLARLKAESSGILNWLLHGLAQTKDGTIPMPQSVANAVQEYRKTEDDLGDFIEEATQDAEATYKTRKQELYQAYRTWADANGIRLALTQKQLTRALKEREGWNMDLRRECWIGKSIRH